MDVEPIAPYLQPVTKIVRVPLPPDEAYDLFANQIGAWWPLGRRFSINGERAVTCGIEGHVGGAVFELRDDGERFEWGRVLTWSPPHRLVLSWHPGRPAAEAQEVEVTFSADGGGTRVELVHREWQRVGTAAAQLRESYDGGWQVVFEHAYAAAAARIRGEQP